MKLKIRASSEQDDESVPGAAWPPLAIALVAARSAPVHSSGNPEWSASA